MKRWILRALALFFLLIVTGAGITSAADVRPQPSQGSSSTEADQEALVGSCGVERWSVKTGTDADVGLINLQSSTQTTIAALSFYYWPASNDTASYAWQEADIINGSGQALQQLFQRTANDRAWIPFTIDLSRYAGQTIGIRFLDHENSNGSSYYTYMYVDDVVLTVN